MPRDESRRPPRRPAREEAPRAAAAPTAPARQRIAKAMARAGLCSRRDAETWIAEGRISVNGRVLTSPALDVGPDDVVLVDGAPMPQPEATRLFLFHKPRGLVTSDHDPEGRPTVADYLRENWPEGPRVMTIGRLDINTEGLLLLTNDGGLARTLELPQTGWLRRYRVRARGETDQASLDRLAGGLTVDGVDYLGIEATLDRVQGSNCWLTMGLREGKNREIKRVLEHVGLEVNRLIRLSFGPFQLLDLPDGAVEEVRPRVLRDQLGPTLCANLGLSPASAAPAAESAERERFPPREPSRGPRPIGEQTRDDRERSPRQARKHVSALRTDSRQSAQGPRRRIERDETADRNARPVRVERLVATREHEDRPPRRQHASPSARGKQARVARSGAPYQDDRRSQRDVDDRRRSGPRDERPKSPRDERSKSPRDERSKGPRVGRRDDGPGGHRRRDDERQREPGPRTGSIDPRRPRPRRENSDPPKRGDGERRARAGEAPPRERPRGRDKPEGRSGRPSHPAASERSYRSPAVRDKAGKARSRDDGRPSGPARGPRAATTRPQKGPPGRSPRGPAKPRR